MFEFSMDAHMHFDLYENRDEILEYIESKKSYTIAVTNLSELFQRYDKKYADKKFVKIALGFHPELVAEYKYQQVLFHQLVDKTRFIGEVGLDFADASDKDKNSQIAVFQNILSWCTNKEKILSVHSRAASKEVISILDGFNGKVILHWYSGRIMDLETALSRGYYLSVNHQMLESERGRNIVNKLPVDRILIESDAPFTKGMKSKYTLNFNEKIYLYLANRYNQEIDIVKKRIKANFAEVLNSILD